MMPDHLRNEPPPDGAWGAATPSGSGPAALSLMVLLCLAAAAGCGVPPQPPAPPAVPSPVAGLAGPVAGASAPADVSGRADRKMLGRFNRRVQSLAPRPPGSDTLGNLRAYLAETLAGFGLAVREEQFTARTPGGDVQMANVIAEKAGDPDRVVYLATHIDTKEIQGARFLGANDSGSSTVAVLELARLISLRPTRCTYRFAFFDGEESFGRSIMDGDGLYGSRHHASRLRADGGAEKVKAFVLLDMVGDPKLNVLRDLNSSPDLYREFAECALGLGYPDILDPAETAMVDDHVPFGEMGVPVLDIIDFDFGPDNSFWHTEQDSPDRVSVESMARVADCVLCMAAGFERR